MGALREYLRRQWDGPPGLADLTIEQFPDGHSNLTYLLRMGGREYVLRRPPLGPVAPKAHDMVREYHVLRAVHPHYPQAPEAFLVCEDPAVLGAPFFVMERRRGIVLRERIPPSMAAVAAHPQTISEAFLDALVKLHSIDVGPRRAARRWAGPKAMSSGRCADGRTVGSAPRPKSCRRWSRWSGGSPAASPSRSRPALIHNDYKLDNVMLAADSPGRVEAVLDWEMATTRRSALRPRFDSVLLGVGHGAGGAGGGNPRAHVRARMVHARSDRGALCGSDRPRRDPHRLL